MFFIHCGVDLLGPLSFLYITTPSSYITLMDVITTCILSNFSLVALWLALALALISVLVRGSSLTAADEYETFLRYLFLFPGAFASFYVFLIYRFFPGIAASSLDWPPSPFQWEVASAGLAFGIICLLSLRSCHGFRLATIIGFTVWLWAISWGYLMEVIGNNGVVSMEGGLWLCVDFILPALMLFFYVAWRRALDTSK